MSIPKVRDAADKASQTYQRTQETYRTKYRAHYEGFIAGAAFGFEQALEWLRSGEAQHARMKHSLDACIGDGKMQTANLFFADWLEEKRKKEASDGQGN